MKTSDIIQPMKEAKTVIRLISCQRNGFLIKTDRKGEISDETLQRMRVWYRLCNKNNGPCPAECRIGQVLRERGLI
jgi:hypothetical protein